MAAAKHFPSELHRFASDAGTEPQLSELDRLRRELLSHKGLPGGLFNAEHCSPRDIPVVAKMFPDTSWVAYHSAYRFDGGPRRGEVAYQEGSMVGIDSLITSALLSARGGLALRVCSRRGRVEV